MRTRKHLLSIVLMACWMVNADRCLAQVIFYFSDWVPGVVDAPVLDAHGNPLSDVSHVALLYGGMAPDSLQPAVDYESRLVAPIPISQNALGQAGYFTDGLVEVTSTACSSFAWLQVRAWDTRLGSTYEAVEALGVGGYGASTVFRAEGGLVSPCIINPGPAGYLRGLESFRLVPEPSSFLLLVCGLAALVALRRRRLKVVPRQFPVQK